MEGVAEELERRIDKLRAAVRQAIMAGDRTAAAGLRRELREAERAWDEAVAGLAQQVVPAPRGAGALLPVREQVHHALTLLSVPAAPRLIGEVHRAFFAGDIVGARLTSLRRDEERSFRLAPYSRPYYLCAVLSADVLAPARGLLAVSTWPLERRIVGPLSPRVDFLTCAIRVAEHVERLPEAGTSASRLLWRFAANIPGLGMDPGGAATAAAVAAARAELAIHAEADRSHRAAGAARATEQLDDAGRFFGTPRQRANLPRTARSDPREGAS
ncbi:hypothetical protein GCM10009682_59800 [Luedemannella flava]|uniref:Uncharacterized protein n=1 Tax=Luedemannella flava TaxID=349316 RepID=A0ABN2MQ07_9ACTN